MKPHLEKRCSDILEKKVVFIEFDDKGMFLEVVKNV